MENETVNLDGTQYISDVPSVYYGATSSLVSKIDPFAGNLMGKVTLPGGTVISTTINLINDPENPGKVIASTTLASGITYIAAGFVADMAITEVLVGAALASAGIVASPLAISIATVGGLAVLATVGGSELQSFIYNGLELAQEQTEVVLMSPEITGTITQEEFIIQSLEDNPTFCMEMFPEYLNYRQIVEIKSGGSLAEYIKYDSQTKEADIQLNDPQAVQEQLNVLLNNTEVQNVTIDTQTYTQKPSQGIKHNPFL